MNKTAWKIREIMVFLQVRDGLKDLPEEGLPVIEMDWLLGYSTTSGILWPPLEERDRCSDLLHGLHCTAAELQLLKNIFHGY